MKIAPASRRFRPFAAVLCVAVLVAMLATGCNSQQSSTTEKPAEEKSQLILATTTSTQDTGLLDELVIPEFNKKYPQYEVKTIAVGSGEAMAMGAKGDADVLLVHSPKDEDKFMADGNGSSRKAVMHNDFVVVGPKSDPAKVKGTKSAADAFKNIADAKAAFITRGDDSGTHKKELKIWDEAGVKPSGAWYVNTGQGMGETLRIADQKSGYTLTDRGTWLSTKSSLPNLEIVVEGDNLLQNFYHVIVVSKKKFPKINEQGAIAFSDFIISPETQKMIGEFGKAKYGQPLFIPDAGKKE